MAVTKRKTTKKKTPAVKKKMGAPAISFNQDVADTICEETAASSKSLATILNEHPEFPRLSTIYKWLNANEDFAKSYARAKDAQADYLAEEIIEIADDGTNDTIETDKGPMENKEWVNRSKLRVDARKWIAAKLKPKKYGDKIEHSGELATTPTAAPIIQVITTGKPLANTENEVDGEREAKA